MAPNAKLLIGIMLTASLGAALSGCNESSAASSTSSGTSSGTSAAAGSVSGIIAPSSAAAVSTAPSISGAPAAGVAAGATYEFVPAINNPGGAKLSFAIQHIPAWAHFDTATGLLSGTPSAANVGISSDIVISVTNSAGTATLPAFSITVDAPNVKSLLAISGTPASSVSVGSPFRFRPSVVDAAGAKLTYAISNKPSWATFDASTGTLTGTPGVANIGVDSGIAIRVSDGTTTAELTAFSIKVASAPADSVALSWTPPVVNADGTPATDLSGYHIYYGTSEKSMTHVVTVSGATDTQHVVGNLSAGTWFFAITSFNAASVDSKLSVVVGVTI